MDVQPSTRFVLVSISAMVTYNDTNETWNLNPSCLFRHLPQAIVEHISIFCTLRHQLQVNLTTSNTVPFSDYCIPTSSNQFAMIFEVELGATV